MTKIIFRKSLTCFSTMQRKKSTKKIKTKKTKILDTAWDTIKHSFFTDDFFVLTKARSRAKSLIVQKALLKINVW